MNSPALNPADLGDFLRIGSAYNSQFGGVVRVCEVAILSGYLADADFALLVKLMRASAAKRDCGIDLTKIPGKEPGKAMNDIIAVCVFAHRVSSKKIPGVSRYFFLFQTVC